VKAGKLNWVGKCNLNFLISNLDLVNIMQYSSNLNQLLYMLIVTLNLYKIRMKIEMATYSYIYLVGRFHLRQWPTYSKSRRV